MVHEMAVRRTLSKIDESLLETIGHLTEAKRPWPLFVFGRAGTGKTCAALCVLDYCRGGYYSATKLCGMLIDAQNGRLSWHHGGRGGIIYPEMFWNRIGNENLSVLDEIGCREKVSDHQYECVKRFIDARQGRPAIYLSNLSLDQISQVYDDRISSRLASGTVVGLMGQDRRLTK